MKSISWADWWASRTIRFNTAMAALFTASLPILIMVDEAQLVALGLSPKIIMIAMALIKIADNFANNKFRAITTKPLAGRAE
jgi:hypothetical protein